MARTVVPRRGITEGTCERCGSAVLRGQASGFALVLDPTQLDEQAELTHAVAGCRTVGHWTVAAELEMRHPRAILARPASGTPRYVVHPLHQCAPTQDRTPTP